VEAALADTEQPGVVVVRPAQGAAMPNDGWVPRRVPTLMASFVPLLWSPDLTRDLKVKMHRFVGEALQRRV